jgi:hypothetical protein
MNTLSSKSIQTEKAEESLIYQNERREKADISHLSLGTATGLFVAFFLLYGLFLSKLKEKMNTNFSSSSFRKKMQHLILVVNCPESFQDWDTGNP